PLGLPPAHVLSISPTGQMALLLLRPFALLPRIGHMAFEQVYYRDPFLLDGTLGVASLAGGAPSELLEDVTFADWMADGGNLAVVHRAGNQHRVEAPVAKTLWDHEEVVLNHVRVQPGTGRVSFQDWGQMYATDENGGVRQIGSWESFEPGWSETTGELWYTIARSAQTEIHALKVRAVDRLLATL